MNISFVNRGNVGEYLGWLAHEEDGEVVGVLILLLHIIQNKFESFLILFVYDWLLAVAWDVKAVNLVKKCLDIIKVIQIWNGNHSYTRLLQKLYMCFRDVWNLLVGWVDCGLSRLLSSYLNFLDIVKVATCV